MTLDWIRKEFKKKKDCKRFLSPVVVLHNDTFALLGPWIALLVRRVNQRVCLFMFFNVLPHPEKNNYIDVIKVVNRLHMI